jgi:hypothetical protein
MKAICGMTVALLFVSVWVTADEAAAPPEPASRFGQKFIATRLSVGARFTFYWLEDTRRCANGACDNRDITGNFLGSLWGLDAQQHYFPNPYLEYRVVSAFGVGVMYDELRARTLDWANDEHTQTAGDGDLELRGVGVYLVARYRNRSRFEPYANAGFAWYQSHFYVSPGWAAPGRSFEVEDTQGWFGALGCKVRLGRHMGVDALFRHSDVGDVSARAYLGIGNRYRAGAFPMRYDALAIGAVYTF